MGTYENTGNVDDAATLQEEAYSGTYSAFSLGREEGWHAEEAVPPKAERKKRFERLLASLEDSPSQSQT